MKVIYAVIKEYITEEGRAAIEAQGSWVFDKDGDKGTPTIGENRECAYALYDKCGILKCGIEQAYLDGKTNFKKPISCHLYPIRIKKYDEFEALNYDRWDICSAACTLGSSLGVPVYKFLKDALIRKFGIEWYDELVAEIEGSGK